MFDRGLNLTLRAVRRHIAAMPHDLYLIRLIHNQTRRAFPGERLWTAAQLQHPATLRFLRVRNREGCDVYIQPYAENRNPGYILVDLDHRGPEVVETMRAMASRPAWCSRPALAIFRRACTRVLHSDKRWGSASIAANAVLTANGNHQNAIEPKVEQSTTRVTWRGRKGGDHKAGWPKSEIPKRVYAADAKIKIRLSHVRTWWR